MPVILERELGESQPTPKTRLVVVPQSRGVPEYRLQPLHVGSAAVWLAASVGAVAVSGEPVAGVVILAAVAVLEAIAPADDYGSKSISAFVAFLAISVLGMPEGLLVALGTVIVGDGVLRKRPVRDLVWRLGLYAAMLTGGAASVGLVADGVPDLLPRAAGVAWVAVYVAWLFQRCATTRTVAATPMLQALSILFTISAGFTAPLWGPWLSSDLMPWTGAAFTGMAFVSTFMLIDLLGASGRAWHAGGTAALGFWFDHLPVLFVRYVGQGVAAGLAAYWFSLSGVSVLMLVLTVAVAGEAAYCLYRMNIDTTNSALAALVSAIDARDPYTAGHSVRVSEYATRVATHLGWSKARVERVRIAGLLHDIGKLGVPDAVLNKPGRFEPHEFETMKRHASLGETIVANIRGWSQISTIVGQDHERWSGGGYPRGLAGEEIVPEARLIAIADVFDALTTDRPYRGALTEEAALGHLDHEAGQQLDPTLVAAFVHQSRGDQAAGVAFCFCATH